MLPVLLGDSGMTFDARGESKSSGGNTLVFGAITLTVVAGAFFAVLSLPKPDPAPQPVAAATLTPSHQAPAQDSAVHAAFEGKSARNFLAAMAEVDPAARNRLDRRLATAQPYDHTRIAMEEATTVLARHSDQLAQADMRHVDAWLDMTRKGLRKASRSRHRWCAGSRYQDFNAVSGLSGQMAAASDLAELGSELSDYTFDSFAHAFRAIGDARSHPVQHGPVTSRDEAALQSLAMSLISDPQIMPLLMASGRDGPSDSALAALDVCDLGVTALTAFKTLPQGTKGRVFADMVKSADFENVGIDNLRGLPNL
jgi:hypothetical protein